MIDLTTLLQNMVITTPVPIQITQQPIIQTQEDYEVPKVDIMNQIGLAIKRR